MTSSFRACPTSCRVICLPFNILFDPIPLVALVSRLCLTYDFLLYRSVELPTVFTNVSHTPTSCLSPATPSSTLSTVPSVSSATAAKAQPSCATTERTPSDLVLQQQLLRKHYLTRPRAYATAVSHRRSSPASISTASIPANPAVRATSTFTLPA